MIYKAVELNPELNIEKIIGVHYFEYEKDFVFLGEKHNFWEVIYSDKDYLTITVRSTEEIIPPGHFRLISPMEFHSIKPAYGKAANVVMFSFQCSNEKLFKFSGRTIKCDSEKKEYIAKLISAAQETFITPLGEPYCVKMMKNPKAPVGAETLLKIYLELFLLSCIRENIHLPVTSAPLTHISNPQLSEICSFLEKNVCEDISFPGLCEKFGMSKTNMKALFREYLNTGAMEYFSKCKIDCAKRLIREKEMNLSEISEYLSFTSQQYFSRRFKNLTGMTPSQYSQSVIKT